MGANSVEECGLGVQSWLGATPYDPGRIQQVTWDPQPIEKPQHAFFTSSWDGHTSAWITWRAAQPGRSSESRGIYQW